MKKIFTLLLFIPLIMSTGCGENASEKDDHYKPSEFKHNVAISEANRTMRDIEKEIVAMGAETSADVVLVTYQDSLNKLNEQLTKLENTKKLLEKDKDLSNSELKSWTTEYNNTIKGVQITIKDVETQKNDFLK